MNAKLIVAVVVALAAGFLGGVWLGGDGAVEEAGAATYICPMHPTVVSDKPGSCPDCGMDLVKDREESGADSEDEAMGAGAEKVSVAARRER